MSRIAKVLLVVLASAILLSAPANSQESKFIAINPVVVSWPPSGPITPPPPLRQNVVIHGLTLLGYGSHVFSNIIPVDMQLAGSAQALATTCAQRSETNTGLYEVGAFEACAQNYVILSQPEQAVMDCAVSSATKQLFAQCAAPQLGVNLTPDQQLTADCAMQAGGDPDNFTTCAGPDIVQGQLTPEQQSVLDCATNADGDSSNFAGCAVGSIVGPQPTEGQRVAVECAAESNGDSANFAVCAGVKFLNLHINAEQQVAVSCIVETDAQPYAAAGCIATELTTLELNKCQYGIGGDDGCFGNNNDLVGRNGWTARTLDQIAGGPNSIVNNPSQLLGGPNSVFNNPAQLAGGPNSVVNTPGQLLGGPNSFMHNPGQVTGGPNSVINNPGQVLGGNNSVVHRPCQLFGAC